MRTIIWWVLILLMAKEIMLFTDAGKVIRFAESLVRPMGRTARGVRGIRVQEDNR